MKTLVVYSSVTGNTKTVAEAIAEALPQADLFPVHKAPHPGGYDMVIPGFWVYRGKPDPRMLRYMEKIKGQKTAFFGTLAAWPDSPHAMGVLRHARALLEQNEILGEFLCLGRLHPKRLTERMDPSRPNSGHPMTEERRTRLLEAQKHPDADDLARAAALFAEWTSK